MSVNMLKTAGVKSGRTRAAGFEVEAFESRQMLSVSGGVVTPNLKVAPAKSSHTVVISGYTPAQIKAAYGFSSLKGDGTGQTIAIVDAFNHPAIASDLAVFSKQFGLPSANLTVVNQAGGSVRKLAVDSGWAGETALDVEWAHAIAPGAKILLVEATSDDESNLMAAVNYARSVPGVSVVSTSWGESEAVSDLTYDSYFTTPAGHAGVTFVSASGDEGAAYGPEFPASSPNVLAVGGTTLNLTSKGGIVSETAWRDSTGGTSLYEKTPTYQTGVATGTYRSVPDVSYNADPNTGFAVYDSIRDSGVVGWQVVAGTSAGTPQWAALIAIANQLRVKAGLGTLDGASQTLPTIYSLYGGSATSLSYATSFYDVSTGGASRGRGFGGRFGGLVGGSAGAKVGYDTVTGLGSPKAAAVVQALVASTFKSAVPTKAASSKRHGSAAVVHKSAIVLTTAEVSGGIPLAATSIFMGTGGGGVANAETSIVRVVATPAAAKLGTGAIAGGVSTIADPMLRRLAAVAVGDVVQSSVTLADGNFGLPALTPAVARAATATVDVLQKGSAVLRFPHFDPSVMFNDLLGAFVEESATVASAVRGDATTWAAAVTVAVLGFDAALFARWFVKARGGASRRTGREELPALDS